jgi:hypothetical protein
MSNKKDKIIIGLDSIYYGQLKHDLGFYKGLFVGMSFILLLIFAYKLWQLGLS